jgi:hypothetical protein
MAVETRRKIFDRAVADKLIISGTHWPMPNVGRLAKDGDSYVFAAEGLRRPGAAAARSLRYSPVNPAFTGSLLPSSWRR